MKTAFTSATFRLQYPVACNWSWPDLPPACHQLVTKGCFHLNHTSVSAPSQSICISLSVSHHTTFRSVSHLVSHSLVPACTAPSPSISIYPGSCVVYFVYLPEDRPCCKTLSSEKQKKCLLKLVESSPIKLSTISLGGLQLWDTMIDYIKKNISCLQDKGVCREFVSILEEEVTTTVGSKRVTAWHVQWLAKIKNCVEPKTGGESDVSILYLWCIYFVLAVSAEVSTVSESKHVRSSSQHDYSHIDLHFNGGYTACTILCVLLVLITAVYFQRWRRRRHWNRLQGSSKG